MTDIVVALKELSIEVTNRCLCRCIHCSSGSHPIYAAEDNVMSPKEHFQLIREARDLGATVLSLSGGDPIVMGDVIVDYVRLAASIGYERVLFYTTGIWDVLYDDLVAPGAEPLGAMWGIDSWPHIDELIGAGGTVLTGNALSPNILTIIFSLHSHRPEVHDFIMGIPGAWYTTTGSIMAMTARGVNVEVHMVPMRINHGHIPKVRNLCMDMKVSKLSLLRFVPQTRGFSNRHILAMNPQEFECMQYVLDYEADLAHPVEMRFGCPIDFRHTIGATDGKPKPCHAGLDLILVRPDGSVHPCAAWKTLPGDANVKNHSLEEIWEESSLFCSLREFHTVGYERLVGPCGNCHFLQSCKGGCPAQRLHAYGKEWEDLYAPTSDPLCPIGERFDGIAMVGG